MYRMIFSYIAYIGRYVTWFQILLEYLLLLSLHVTNFPSTSCVWLCAADANALLALSSLTFPQMQLLLYYVRCTSTYHIAKLDVSLVIIRCMCNCRSIISISRPLRVREPSDFYAADYTTHDSLPIAMPANSRSFTYPQTFFRSINP